MRTPAEIDEDIKTRTKVCGSCRQRKSFEDYYKSKVSRDKAQGRCKLCTYIEKRNWKSNLNPKHKNIRVQEEILSDLALGSKTCGGCNTRKNLSEFGKDLKRPDGVAHMCVICRREYVRETIRDKRRNTTLKYKYGISQDIYISLLSLQDNRCAICSRDNSILELVVDHDHTTGKVRGLLCRQCNIGIGNLQDDPNVLLKASNYLNLHREI